jgi:hypothetical protein
MMSFRLRGSRRVPGQARRGPRRCSIGAPLDAMRRRLDLLSVIALGATDATVLLTRDGSPFRWNIRDWGAVALLACAASLLATGKTMRSARAWRASRRH